MHTCRGTWMGFAGARGIIDLIQNPDYRRFAAQNVSDFFSEKAEAISDFVGTKLKLSACTVIFEPEDVTGMLPEGATEKHLFRMEGKRYSHLPFKSCPAPHICVVTHVRLNFQGSFPTQTDGDGTCVTYKKGETLKNCHSFGKQSVGEPGERSFMSYCTQKDMDVVATWDGGDSISKAVFCGYDVGPKDYQSKQHSQLADACAHPCPVRLCPRIPLLLIFAVETCNRCVERH